MNRLFFALKFLISTIWAGRLAGGVQRPGWEFETTFIRGIFTQTVTVSSESITYITCTALKSYRTLNSLQLVYRTLTRNWIRTRSILNRSVENEGTTITTTTIFSQGNSIIHVLIQPTEETTVLTIENISTQNPPTTNFLTVTERYTEFVTSLQTSTIYIASFTDWVSTSGTRTKTRWRTMRHRALEYIPMIFTVTTQPIDTATDIKTVVIYQRTNGAIFTSLVGEGQTLITTTTVLGAIITSTIAQSPSTLSAVVYSDMSPIQAAITLSSMSVVQFTETETSITILRSTKTSVTTTQSLEILTAISISKTALTATVTSIGLQTLTFVSVSNVADMSRTSTSTTTTFNQIVTTTSSYRTTTTASTTTRTTTTKTPISAATFNTTDSTQTLSFTVINSFISSTTHFTTTTCPTTVYQRKTITDVVTVFTLTSTFTTVVIRQT